MNVPSVSIYGKKGRVIITATFSPGRGTYVDKRPAFALRSADVEGIGNAIILALAEYSVGGEMPNFIDGSYNSPAQEVAGIGTWDEFERGLKSCVLSEHEDFFLIRGDRPAVKIPRASTAEEVGAAALRGLAARR